MREQKSSELSLKALEAEVLAEGREWTRQRLQQRLQAQAEQAGAVFPPPATAAASPDVAHGRGQNNPERPLRSRSAKR
jgi:hypothetical protein